MRSRWMDVSLDEYDYLTARVEALTQYVAKLERENTELRNTTDSAGGGRVPEPSYGYPMPSVLVRTMPVPHATGGTA